MREITEYDMKLVKSPIPYIAAGASWLGWALFLPLYQWYHYIGVAALSVAVYFVASRIFPAKQIKIPRRRKMELSGDNEVDGQIKNADKLLKNIEASAKTIGGLNPSLASDSIELSGSGYQILSYIAKYPDRASLVRRFLSYYLPTLDKLLSSYIEFKLHNTASGTVAEIEQTVPAMKTVFQKQIDKLLMDRELDISTDIDVLEGKLSSEGLNDAKK